MQRFLRAVAVLTAALLLVLCLPSCQDKTLAGRSFYFPLDAEPRQLDPQVSTDRSSMTVAAALFEGSPAWMKTERPFLPPHSGPCRRIG